MIYRIAEPAVGGKGLVGIYPSWQEGEHALDAILLEQTREHYFSILFMRNYFAQFFQRIAPALQAYGQYIDIVAGWEIEKIRLTLLPLNPNVEVFRLSAMHFNHFELMDHVRQTQLQTNLKEFDIFFTVVERPDQLKNLDLLTELLSKVQLPLKVVGYGKWGAPIWRSIAQNKHLAVTFREKTKVDDLDERRQFLEDLVHSRCLLVTSKYEGYCRLIGEALYLQVPVLLPADIQCENWVHLSQENCRLYLPTTFEACLKEMIGRNWSFSPPVFKEGNQLLRKYFNAYLMSHGMPSTQAWYPLQYGALNDQLVTLGT